MHVHSLTIRGGAFCVLFQDGRNWSALAGRYQRHPFLYFFCIMTRRMPIRITNFFFSPLTRGAVLYSGFLHCNVSGHLSRVEDCKPNLGAAGVFSDVDVSERFQMNHLWRVTLKTTATKRRLSQAQTPAVKWQKCFLLDPKKEELQLKIHCVIKVRIQRSWW